LQTLRILGVAALCDGHILGLTGVATTTLLDGPAPSIAKAAKHARYIDSMESMYWQFAKRTGVWAEAQEAEDWHT
jgi:hypothetical protein